MPQTLSMLIAKTAADMTAADDRYVRQEYAKGNAPSNDAREVFYVPVIIAEASPDELIKCRQTLEQHVPKQPPETHISRLKNHRGRKAASAVAGLAVSAFSVTMGVNLFKEHQSLSVLEKTMAGIAVAGTVLGAAKVIGGTIAVFQDNKHLTASKVAFITWQQAAAIAVDQRAAQLTSPATTPPVI